MRLFSPLTPASGVRVRIVCKIRIDTSLCSHSLHELRSICTILPFNQSSYHFPTFSNGFNVFINMGFDN